MTANKNFVRFARDFVLSTLRKILQHKRHVNASHWDPSKLRHISTGIFYCTNHKLYLFIVAKLNAAVANLSYVVA